MKVLIKQIDYFSNNNKVVGSFNITQEEFIAFLFSKEGKKVLKEIAPPNLKLNHPSIINFMTMFYQMMSSPVAPGVERDFWMYEPSIKTVKNHTKLFLKNYFPQQVSITFKPK